MSSLGSEFLISELVHESLDTSIYRAMRPSEQKPVILKLLRPVSASVEALERFRLEYETTAALKIPGVVQARELRLYQSSMLMVLEDIGGESLDRVLKGTRLEVCEAIELAIRLARTLGELHDRRVIHQAISPAHIVWNRGAGEFRLIDFGNVTDLPWEKPALNAFASSEKPLAFISPEQTGRMNRVVDYRTDFYSLGATLYWVLTGSAPFEDPDPMALIYSHLAKPPRPPHELNAAVPPALSAIVLKLLSKMAEDRYQSATGLIADLERCAEGQVWEFPLGLQDQTDRLQLPQKLYGREREVAFLMEAFSKASQGARECLLIGGYAGVGKTALVHEIHRPITQKQGFFVEGKFDQYQSAIPYSAWIQALNGLVNQLLIAPPERLARWKAELLAAIGPNGQILLDVIPNLALVIGQQPEVAELGPVEAEHRFSHVFKALIRSLARAEYPLVIFLDDLQWIDAASLNLLKTLLGDPELGHFLLIGAYRDNEVDSAHPLMTAIQVRTLHLLNLSEADVADLLSESLRQSRMDCLPLARLIHSKTSGNPFFTHQMLNSLVDQGRLRFNGTTRRWEWNLQELESMGITDNVVSLMTQKLKQFPAATQETLQLAACSGNQFDLQTLAVIAELGPREAMERLRPAMLEGLIIPMGESYKLLAVSDNDARGANASFRFLHDRVQQAAYLLASDEKRKPIHLKIGYRLLSHAGDVFDIVQHLNQGVDLVENPQQRLELIRLNLLAGKRARNAAAYASSYEYLLKAIEIAEPESLWENHYPLCLELFSRATELAALTGNFEQMEHHFSEVIRSAQNVLDQVDAYRSRIQGCVAQGDLQRALDTGLEILALLGARFPSHPSESDIAEGREEARSAHAGVSIESLFDLPLMSDPRQLAIMRIVAQTLAAAYIGRPSLLLLFTYYTVALSIRSGNTPESTYLYVVYALVLCGAGEFDLGIDFAKLAVRLLEKLNAAEYKSKVLEVANGHVWHFKQHLRETIAPLEEGFHSGLQTGDLEYAGYNAFFISCNSYFAGLELGKLERSMASYQSRIQGVAETARRWQVSFWQATQNLLGRSKDPTVLSGEACDADELLPVLRQTNNKAAMGTFFLNSLILNYLFGNHSKAVEYCTFARENEDGLNAMVAVPALFFYESLTFLAVFGSSTAAERERLLKKVEANQRTLEEWARHAPMNHLHKWQLVEAEKARVLGRGGDAREFYDLAISSARENQYLQEEALAHELASRFYFARGQEAVAEIYLKDAHAAYLRWGAVAKARQLQKRSAKLAQAEAPAPLASLDAATLVRASQTLSKEMDLDKLLDRLLRLVIENAGATKGALIECENGNFAVRAIAWGLDRVETYPDLPLERCAELPQSVVHFVARTRKNGVWNDVASQASLASDSYIRRAAPKSIAGIPVEYQGELQGVLVLENSLTTDAFAFPQLELLNVLTSQAGISFANSRFFEKLKQKTEELDRFFSLSLDLLCIADIDGRFRLLNPDWERTLGYSMQELQGRRFMEFVHPDDVGSTRAVLSQAAQEKIINFVNRYRCRDGSYRWLEWRSAPAGELIYAAARDITQRVQAEHELKAAKEEAEAASRIKAQFLDIAAHELRTPLTAFSLMVQLSKQKVEKGENLPLSTFDRIGRQVTRLNGLVDDLLDVSRLERGVMSLRKAKTDLCGLVAETLEDFRAQARTRKFSLATPASEVLVEADPMRIQQVVGNLLENALKYTPEPCAIDVEVGISPENRVRVSVRDYGPGIAKEHQGALFTRFFRASSDATIRHPGLGLGLFICRSIIELHGGSIDVISEPGQGCTFFFELPLVSR